MAPALAPGVAFRACRKATMLTRMTRMVVPPENQLGGPCVHAQNSLAGVRMTGPRPPAWPAGGRVYHRSRVTAVSALYPGSRRSQAFAPALTHRLEPVRRQTALYRYGVRWLPGPGQPPAREGEARDDAHQRHPNHRLRATVFSCGPAL